MCPSAPRVCSKPGGQKPVLSLSLDLIGYTMDNVVLQVWHRMWKVISNLFHIAFIHTPSCKKLSVMSNLYHGSPKICVWTVYQLLTFCYLNIECRNFLFFLIFCDFISFVKFLSNVFILMDRIMICNFIIFNILVLNMQRVGSLFCI